MSKVIIGIHGMRNKPEAALLKQWWKQSIYEGLSLNGYRIKNIRFELIYWADLMYPNPLSPAITDPKNPLWIEFPYAPSAQLNHKKANTVRKKLLDVLEKETDRIFLNTDGSLNFESLTDKIMYRFFRDLAIYFTSNCANEKYTHLKAKDAILDRVVKVLKKFAKREILLMGHSMGTILAYDALTYRLPDLKIHTLVTAGSPLGLPPIMNKLLIEQDPAQRTLPLPITPENIQKNWYNLSDLNDKIAINYSLSDDYGPNSQGVKPIDKIVFNDYEYDGRKNSHKSFGYLRSPEMAKIVNEFLLEGRPMAKTLENIWGWLRNRFSPKTIQE